VIYLLLASLIWAFSFGLIKDKLGALDASFVAASRLLVSLLVFLPLLRRRGLSRGLTLRLVAIGALQYGAMYLTYVAAFRHLKAYEVALFTVSTPIYVTLIDDLFARRLDGPNLATALLAVIGAGIVSYTALHHGAIAWGALLVQASNLCFAFGQVAYRRWLGPEFKREASEAAPSHLSQLPVKDQEVFALLFLGGFGVAAVSSATLTNWSRLTLDSTQVLTLLYLGAVASGLGFFVWNVGARRVEAGALAIFNDLKIPLAVAVSLLCFGEKTSGRPSTLVLGGSVVLAALALHEWVLARRRKRSTLKP
jgi:drug/metabolite transporter (DMT)-like permease